MDEIKSGVYILTIGDKRYIGSSIDIGSRVASHVSALHRGDHSRKIQSAFDSSGSVCVSILEEIPKEKIVWDLEVCEKKWIESLKPELNHFIPGNESNSPFSLVNYAVRLLLSTHKFLSEREKIDYKIRILKCTARRILNIAELAEKRLSTIESALSKRNKEG